MTQSRFVYRNKPSNDLGDVITSNYATVNVIDRFPKAGVQPAGTSFAVTVEVQTYGTGAFLRNPFMCLDAFVAVRGLGKYGNRILGGQFVRTFLTDNCIGKATIQFDPEFKPDSTSQVQFELYPGGSMEWFQDQTTLSMVKSGKIKPIAISQPMNFSQSIQEGIQSGTYQTEIDAWGSVPDISLNAKGTIRNAAIFVGVGLAAYLIFIKTAPGFIEESAESINNSRKKLKEEYE